MEHDQIKLKKLRLFRKQVQEKMCRLWSTPQELKAVTALSLAQLIEKNPRPGWVRSSIDTPDNFIENNSSQKSSAERKKSTSNKICSKFLEQFHQKSIHDVRDLIIKQMLGSSKDYIMSKFKSIADSYRDTMACVLEASPDELHCTVKIFVEDHNETEISKYKVFTLVRSSDPNNYWSGRPLEYGSSHSHLAGENSSFAALLGIPDRKNTWPSNAYTCFIANNLEKCSNYDSSGLDWAKHHKSTVVFPIRYFDSDEHCPNIVGFLTFDAKKNIFAKKDVFSIHSSAEYHKRISALPLFHVGGIMADLLAASLIMHKAKV